MAKRHRKRHPGVVLCKPDEKRRIGWRARYVDPDTNKTVKVSLNPALRTTDAREDWAARKSRDIQKRKLELETGAPRATQTGFPAAIERYFEDHPKLRARTLQINRGAADILVEWAATAGIKSGDDLIGSKLVEFRASRVKAPKRVHVKGGSRGELKETDELRSASTINIELRAVRRILGYLRELGLLARLTGDNLRDGLKRLPVDLEEAAFLPPADIRLLLDVALKHDGAKFAATRAEHAGEKTKGTTSRYQRAAAPFVAVTLLSGMRFDEVLGLEWSQIDLDALDHDDQQVGVIRLTARTKTRRARKIFLKVSPALRRVLVALRPDKARGRVWMGYTKGAMKAAAKRLDALGAPRWTWQTLRSTCGTYLTNAPSIYGAASAYHSAKQLGHSVSVAEKHYVDVIHVSREHRTLEAAMQIEEQMRQVLEAIEARKQLQQERSPHVAGKRLEAMGHANDQEAV